jgi:serine/threonine protein kinase
MPNLSSASLVEALRDSRLLTPAQQEELAVALQARFMDPDALGQDLLRREWLTPFQLDQVRHGYGRDLVMGAYVLLEHLGDGGMGRVFKACQQRLNRIVALKIIRKELLSQGDAVRRFEREARAAARLMHPNIVTIFDADHVDANYFLVMEYVEGIDLARLIKSSGPLPVPRACDYIRQASLGLQHAFERGLVHRDIKPANLLVAAENDVLKILDMGLARLERARDDASTPSFVTQDGVVLGTPDYIAPEQALTPHAVDIRADIYSLGCTLYYLFTAQPPFPAGTLAQKLLWHQQADPAAIQGLRAEVPDRLTAVLCKMMAKRPQDRYHVPIEVAAALEPFCQTNGKVYAVSAEREILDAAAQQATVTLLPPSSTPTNTEPPRKTPNSNRWIRIAKRSHRFALLAAIPMIVLLAVGAIFLSDSINLLPQKQYSASREPAPESAQSIAKVAKMKLDRVQQVQDLLKEYRFQDAYAAFEELQTKVDPAAGQLAALREQLAQTTLHYIQEKTTDHRYQEASSQLGLLLSLDKSPQALALENTVRSKLAASDQLVAQAKAPVTSLTDAENAMKAAVELQEHFPEFSKEAVSLKNRVRKEAVQVYAAQLESLTPEKRRPEEAAQQFNESYAATDRIAKLDKPGAEELQTIVLRQTRSYLNGLKTKSGQDDASRFLRLVQASDAKPLLAKSVAVAVSPSPTPEPHDAQFRTLLNALAKQDRAAFEAVLREAIGKDPHNWATFLKDLRECEERLGRAHGAEFSFWVGRYLWHERKAEALQWFGRFLAQSPATDFKAVDQALERVTALIGPLEVKNFSAWNEVFASAIPQKPEERTPREWEFVVHKDMLSLEDAKTIEANLRKSNPSLLADAQAIVEFNPSRPCVQLQGHVLAVESINEGIKRGYFTPADRASHAERARRHEERAAELMLSDRFNVFKECVANNLTKFGRYIAEALKASGKNQEAERLLARIRAAETRNYR